MKLVTRMPGARRSFARHGMLEQVRDLGRTLEYVLARYDRLVREVAGTDIPSPDFEGRVQASSREVADVATRLQDLFVLEYEARQAESYAAFGRVPAARPARSATITAASTRPRRSALNTLVPVVAPPQYRERAVVQ
jgi:hypothetical protein